MLGVCQPGLSPVTILALQRQPHSAMHQVLLSILGSNQMLNAVHSAEEVIIARVPHETAISRARPNNLVKL